MSRIRRRSAAATLRNSALAIAVILLIGCHSRYVEVTIDNQGPTSLRLVEVDYPSASFGAEAIAANSKFHYRFKIQGSGSLKLEFTDAQGQAHDVNGPELSEGQEGHLMIVVDRNGRVTWQPSLAKER
jgi:hypothetical protein